MARDLISRVETVKSQIVNCSKSAFWGSFYRPSCFTKKSFVSASGIIELLVYLRKSRIRDSTRDWTQPCLWLAWIFVATRALTLTTIRERGVIKIERNIHSQLCLNILHAMLTCTTTEGVGDETWLAGTFVSWSFGSCRSRRKCMYSLLSARVRP